MIPTYDEWGRFTRWKCNVIFFHRTNNSPLCGWDDDFFSGRKQDYSLSQGHDVAFSVVFIPSRTWFKVMAWIKFFVWSISWVLHFFRFFHFFHFFLLHTYLEVPTYLPCLDPSSEANYPRHGGKSHSYSWIPDYRNEFRIFVRK